MTQENLSLEERMRPEERLLYESYKARLGKESPPEPSHPMFYPVGLEDPVQWSWIKRWATVNGDMNALWFDPEYAKKTRWGGVVAPPLVLLAKDDAVAVGEDFTTSIYKPDCTVNREQYPSFRGSMMANAEFEFFEAIRPGDKLDAVRKRTDIFWRQGSRYRLLFLLGETRYTNQKGQLVAVSRGGAVYMFK